MHTSELDMADSVHPADIDTFIDNAAWAIRSTYHTVLKASPGAAIFGRDMLFDIPFVADWKQIGEYMQNQTDRSNTHENNLRVDYNYKVGDIHLEKRTMDYNDSSYEWNYQDSMRNQIGKNKYPESNTI